MSNDFRHKVYDELIDLLCQFATTPIIDTPEFRTDQYRALDQLSALWRGNTFRSKINTWITDEGAKSRSFWDCVNRNKRQITVAQEQVIPRAPKLVPRSGPTFSQVQQKGVAQTGRIDYSAGGTSLWDYVHRSIVEIPVEHYDLDFDIYGKIVQCMYEFVGNPNYDHVYRYMASNFDRPLLITDEQDINHAILFVRKIRALVSNTVTEIMIKPHNYDRELCPFGVWEPPFDDYSDEGITQIKMEMSLYGNRVGLFDLTNTDCYSLLSSHFIRFYAFYLKNHKSITVLDPHFMIDKSSSLISLWKQAITIDLGVVESGD